MGPITFEEGEQEQRILATQTFQFKPCGFSFIDDHYGLRKGQRHILMGASGKGKSTLARSLLLAYAKNHKVLLYSSEETQDQTKDMISRKKVGKEVYSNISFCCEKTILEDTETNDLERWSKIVKGQIIINDCEIMFFDNLTTSDFYEGQEFKQSMAFLRTLQDIYIKYNIPCFIVAHTKAGIKNDQTTSIEPDDIKGFKSATNKTEHLYTLQTIHGKTQGMATPIDAIVKVVKARGMGNSGSSYILDFDQEARAYTGDKKVSFNVLNEIFKNRQRYDR